MVPDPISQRRAGIPHELAHSDDGNRLPPLLRCFLIEGLPGWDVGKGVRSWSKSGVCRSPTGDGP